MALKITQSNLVGFEAIPGDELDVIRAGTGGEDGSGGLVPQTYLPTVYESMPYSIDLTFEGKYASPADPPEYTTLPATLVTTTFNWASVGLIYTPLTVNSVRISGASSYDFSTQYYNFVKADYNTQTLPPPTSPPYNLIYEYSLPTNKSQMLTYASIFVTIPPDPYGLSPPGGIETVNMDQWIHWSFASARAKVLFLKANGSVPINLPPKV
jgi:hypothetical protein